MNKYIKTNKIKITTLTPVHIGTGEDFYPTNYIINNNSLYYIDNNIDITEFVSYKDIEGIINKNLVDERFLSEYIKFLNKNNAEIKKHSKYSVPIVNAMNTEYNDKMIKNFKFNNKFDISKTIINPCTYESIIPGSSIKGAIRTAIIESLFPANPTIPLSTNKHIDNLLLEPYLINDNTTMISIMNRIKTEDVVVGGSESRKVYYGVNCKKNPENVNNPNIKAINKQRKVFDQRVESITNGISGEFNINLINNNKSKLNSINQLSVMCNNKYLNQFYNDLNNLFDNKIINNNIYNNIFNTLEDVDTYQENKFILRLGKFSGAEAMTLPCREIGKNKSSTSSTYTLASEENVRNEEMLPFGWVLCEII